MNRGRCLLGMTFGGPFRRCSARNASTVAVPERIERSPTDLLKALAGTVNADPTAPPYSMMDDPYLIPSTFWSRVEFALAKEGGRKTALWMAHHWPTLFLHDYDEPRRDAFRPQLVSRHFDPQTMEVSEAQLRKLIADRRVAAAWEVFEKCKEEDVVVPDQLLSELFTLLSFYNSTELLEHLPEAKWLRNMFKLPPETPGTWMEGGFADLLWEMTENKTPEMYAARITAFAKFGKPNEAYELYNQALENGVDVSNFPEVYVNLLTHYTPTLKIGAEKVQFAEGLLRTYAEHCKPDVTVFNAAILGVVFVVDSGSRKLFHSFDDSSVLFPRRVLAEMAACGLKPNPLIYAAVLLSIPKRNHDNVIGVTASILDDLEERTEIEPAHDLDDQLFSYVIKALLGCLASYPEEAVELAIRTEKLAYKGRNALLFTGHHSETFFQQSYFDFLITVNDTELLLEKLFEFAPNRLDVKPWMMEAVIRAIDYSAMYEALPRLWTLARMTLMDQARGGQVSSLILETATNVPPGMGDEKLFRDLADMSEAVLQSFTDAKRDIGLVDVLRAVILSAQSSRTKKAVSQLRLVQKALNGQGGQIDVNFKDKDSPLLERTLSVLVAANLKQKAKELLLSAERLLSSSAQAKLSERPLVKELYALRMPREDREQEE